MTVRVKYIIEHPKQVYYNCFAIWKLPLLENKKIDFLQPYLTTIEFVGIRKVFLKSYKFPQVGSSIVNLYFDSDIQRYPGSLSHCVDCNSALSFIYLDRDEAIRCCHGSNTNYRNALSNFYIRLQECKGIIGTCLDTLYSIKHLMENNMIPETFSHLDPFFHDYNQTDMRYIQG